MKFLRRNSSNELWSSVRLVTPLTQQDKQRFIAVSEQDVLPLVEKYISALETEVSEKWCRCQWIIHPDDVGIKPGACHICGASYGSRVHHGLPEDFESGEKHHFKGRRMRKGDTDATCPVHTREGMIVYFFEWMFSKEAHQ